MAMNDKELELLERQMAERVEEQHDVGFVLVESAVGFVCKLSVSQIVALRLPCTTEIVESSRLTMLSQPCHEIRWNS